MPIASESRITICAAHSAADRANIIIADCVSQVNRRGLKKQNNRAKKQNIYFFYFFERYLKITSSAMI